MLNQFFLTIFWILPIATAQSKQWHASSKPDSRHHPYFEFAHPIRRVAVIGAGPAGLQAAAALLEQRNISVRLFDRAPGPGGNWFYSDELPPRETFAGSQRQGNTDATTHELPTTMYFEEGQDGMTLDERWRAHWHPRGVWSDLHTNSPTAWTSLPGLTYSADEPWSASVHSVQRHVRAYASLHGLNVNDDANITSYSTLVEELAKTADGKHWKLTLRRMQKLTESNGLRVDAWEELFDAVVVAVGHYTFRNIPNINGLAAWGKVKQGSGKWSVNHAQSFRRAEDYAGKTLLIVGASVSATQIAQLASPYVRRLIVSARSDTIGDRLGTSAFMRFPEKAEIFPEIAEFAPLDAPSAPISTGQIRFVNGSVVTGVDEVIFATGYRANTFLPNMVDPRNYSNLHWTGHYIHDPTLAYMHALRPWTHGPYQSQAFARVWAGKARLPNHEIMQREYFEKKYAFGSSAFDLLPQEAGLRMFVGWLNNEAVELGGRMVALPNHEIWEIIAHYTSLNWGMGFINHDSYAAFDQLARKDWPRPPEDEQDKSRFEAVGAWWLDW